jgi:hypothetical protein
MVTQETRLGDFPSLLNQTSTSSLTIRSAEMEGTGDEVIPTRPYDPKNRRTLPCLGSLGGRNV